MPAPTQAGEDLKTAPTEQPLETTPAQPETPTQPQEDAGKTGDSSDPDFQAIFGEIDEPPKKPEAKPEEKKKDSAPKKEPEAPAEDPKEAAHEDPELPAPKEGDSEGMKKVRALYVQAKKEKHDLIAKIEALEAKGTVSDDKKAEKLSKQLEESQGRINSLQKEIGLLRFEESDEFKKNYVKPFNRAAQDAKNMIDELEVVHTDKDGMEVAVKADWSKDFVSLYDKPLGERTKIAQQKFGAAAPIVLDQILKLKRLDSDREAARQEEREQWETKVQAHQEHMAETQKAVAKLWDTVNQDIAKKHPDWFEVPEDDEEAGDVKEKATGLVDHYFNKRDNGLKTEDQVLIEAQMRQRFIAVPLLTRKIAAMKSQIEALEEKIKGYEESDPASPNKRQGGGPPKTDIDHVSSLRPLLQEAISDT